MKVVISECYGGFGLSQKAYEWIWSKYGLNEEFCRTRFERTGVGPQGPMRNDSRLVACIEALGSKANGPSANLVVVDMPDGVKWAIGEYDGYEHVEEQHRVWTSRTNNAH